MVNPDHELKIHPEHFGPVILGLKTAEVRKADRDFKQEDLILLREWWQGDYTGREIQVRVSYVTDLSPYCPGYVLLSLYPVRKNTPIRLT